MYRVGTQVTYKGYTLRKTSKTNWNMSKGDSFGYAPSLKKAKELIDQKENNAMKKQKPQARVRFTTFNDMTGYIIQIRQNESEEWGMESFYPLQETENGRKENVHFSILSTLTKLQTYGYEIDINC